MTGTDGDDDPLQQFDYAVPAAQRQPLNRLADDERASIEHYALGGFERVNQALRGQTKITPGIQHEVDRIRAGLRKYPLRNDTRVTREVSGGVFGISAGGDAQADVEALIGRVFDEPGFMSTTMSPVPAHSPQHRAPITLDLVVPAGTPALAVGALAGFPLEHEMLIIDARRYQILGARYDRDRGQWRLFGLAEPEG